MDLFKATIGELNKTVGIMATEENNRFDGIGFF